MQGVRCSDTVSRLLVLRSIATVLASSLGLRLDVIEVSTQSLCLPGTASASRFLRFDRHLQADQAENPMLFDVSVRTANVQTAQQARDSTQVLMENSPDEFVQATVEQLKVEVSKELGLVPGSEAARTAASHVEEAMANAFPTGTVSVATISVSSAEKGPTNSAPASSLVDEVIYPLAGSAAGLLFLSLAAFLYSRRKRKRQELATVCPLQLNAALISRNRRRILGLNPMLVKSAGIWDTAEDTALAAESNSSGDEDALFVATAAAAANARGRPQHVPAYVRRAMELAETLPAASSSKPSKPFAGRHRASRSNRSAGKRGYAFGAAKGPTPPQQPPHTTQKVQRQQPRLGTSQHLQEQHPGPTAVLKPIQAPSHSVRQRQQQRRALGGAEAHRLQAQANAGIGVHQKGSAQANHMRMAAAGIQEPTHRIIASSASKPRMSDSLDGQYLRPGQEIAVATINQIRLQAGQLLPNTTNSGIHRRARRMSRGVVPQGEQSATVATSSPQWRATRSLPVAPAATKKVTLT